MSKVTKGNNWETKYLEIYVATPDFPEALIVAIRDWLVGGDYSEWHIGKVPPYNTQYNRYILRRR